mmetsp:Transcript_10413/g.19364  ORF Transcript_10413/g.19364 Transcript_10413/m.19364 type:complete len:533 (-) Transcript_10413:35-1633(-)
MTKRKKSSSSSWSSSSSSTSSSSSLSTLSSSSSSQILHLFPFKGTAIAILAFLMAYTTFNLAAVDRNPHRRSHQQEPQQETHQEQKSGERMNIRQNQHTDSRRSLEGHFADEASRNFQGHHGNGIDSRGYYNDMSNGGNGNYYNAISDSQRNKFREGERGQLFQQQFDEPRGLVDVAHRHHRAIALISFGESAAESPLLERGIMSIRRRGEFDGPIMVITDNDLRRYEGVFDENVFLVNAKSEHMKENYFTYDVVKYKRFKTLILEYIDLIPELAHIEFVYYMDIDVMMGAPFLDLVQGLQQKYGVETIPYLFQQNPLYVRDDSVKYNNHRQNNHNHDDGTISTLFFFQNFPASHMHYFACSGFFVMNRHTSSYCLSRWRSIMDNNYEQRMDQFSLTQMAHQIQMGRITRCKMTVMELDNFLSYPLSNKELLDMLMFSSYTNLIHIFNSGGAQKIDDDVTEYFVANVLNLSEEERRRHKFGKNAIAEKAGVKNEKVYLNHVNLTKHAGINGTRRMELQRNVGKRFIDMVFGP